MTPERCCLFLKWSSDWHDLHHLCCHASSLSASRHKGKTLCICNIILLKHNVNVYVWFNLYIWLTIIIFRPELLHIFELNCPERYKISKSLLIGLNYLLTLCCSLCLTPVVSTERREGERQIEGVREGGGGDVYTCRAALVCVTQSGGFQPTALGALTLAKPTLFFSPWNKQALDTSVNWSANKWCGDTNKRREVTAWNVSALHSTNKQMWNKVRKKIYCVHNVQRCGFQITLMQFCHTQLRKIRIVRLREIPRCTNATGYRMGSCRDYLMSQVCECVFFQAYFFL